MLKLISTKQIRDRLSLQDDEGVNAAIKSAMSSAYLRLSSILDTKFEQEITSDYFYVDTQVETVVASSYTLRCKAGFINQAIPIQAYMTDTLTSLSSLSALTTITPILIDYDKGFVLFDDSSVAGKYVKLDYRYGFSVSDVIPDWVQEVMIGLTAKALSSQQIADGKPELSQVFAFLDNQTEVILGKHLRSKSSAISPLL